MLCLTSKGKKVTFKNKQNKLKNWDCTITTNSLTADSKIWQCKISKILPRVSKFKDVFPINFSLFHRKIKQRGGRKMSSYMGVRTKGAFKGWTGAERKFYATCSYLMVSQFVWSSLINMVFSYSPKHGAHSSEERTLLHCITGG